MKIIRLIVLSLAMCALTLPLAAEAGKCRGGKSGVIYNQTDGKYYSVPGKCPGMVYRTVDGRMLPVGKMYCGKKHCKTIVTGVSCQMRPGHWWGYTWYPSSNECWYTVR